MTKTKSELGQELLDAVYWGDLARASRLLSDGASLEYVNSDGCNAGLMAAIAGNIEMYDYLSAQTGFNKNSVDKFGNDAALLAAAFGKGEMYDHLIENHDFDVNAINKSGNNALMMAVEGDVSADVIKRMIAKHPIQLNHPGKDGIAPWNRAMLKGKYDVQEVIQNQQSLDIRLIDALPDVEKFKALCSQGAHPIRVKLGEYDLANFAVFQNCPESYKLLVEQYGFEVRKVDFLRASARDNEAIVTYIAQHHHQQFSALELEEARIYSKNKVILDVLSAARKSRVKLEDVVDCISPNPQVSKWRELDDPTIYYSFDTPSFLPKFYPFTEEEKDFARKIIAENKDLINRPIQEIRLADNERGVIVLRSDPRNTIVIATSDLDLFLKDNERGIVRSYSEPDSQDIAHKRVILYKDFLGKGNSREYAAYVFLHEFFGHAIGGLTHPNNYSGRETGLFCQEDIFVEDSVMSYRDADKIYCEAQKKSAEVDCDITWPQSLRKADLIAINRHQVASGHYSRIQGDELVRLPDPLVIDVDSAQINLDLPNVVESRQDQQSVRSSNQNDTVLYGSLALAGVVAAKAVRRLVGALANAKGNSNSK